VATLHIEHPISDLPASLGAFSRFREARRRAVRVRGKGRASGIAIDREQAHLSSFDGPTAVRMAVSGGRV